ncbi:MAG: hypothetical protein FJ215_07585 [Ignavibacteria bacterium]|nr:hypothetical protein [Ignavibacteria bacterium]
MVYTEVEWEPGVKRRWRKITSAKHGEIDLAAMFDPNTDVVAYAYCRIDSPRDLNVRATFGSNDGIDVILNGSRVFSRRAKRNLTLDEDEALLGLKKGENHLLLRIDQGKAGWGFSFRLPDVVTRSPDHKYRIVD